MFLFPTQRQWSGWSLPSKLGVGTCIGIIGLCFTLYFGFRHNKSIDRPYISIMHVTSPYDVQIGAPLKALITIQNTGKSPAINVQSSAIAQWIPPGKIPNFLYGGVEITGKATIGPGGESLIELHPTKDPKGETGYLVQKDFEAILKKSIVLFVHGHISYDDIFGKSHWTDYCYELDVRGTGEYYWNPCLEHNEMDKN